MSLAHDILPSIRAIAEYIYGEVTPTSERRGAIWSTRAHPEQEGSRAHRKPAQLD